MESESYPVKRIDITRVTPDSNPRVHFIYDAYVPGAGIVQKAFAIRNIESNGLNATDRTSNTDVGTALILMEEFAARGFMSEELLWQKRTDIISGKNISLSGGRRTAMSYTHPITEFPDK